MLFLKMVVNVICPLRVKADIPQAPTSHTKSVLNLIPYFPKVKRLRQVMRQLVFILTLNSFA